MHSCHSLLVAQRRINNVWPKPPSLPRRLYLPAAVQTLAPHPSSSSPPPLVIVLPPLFWSPFLLLLFLPPSPLLSPSALFALAACAPSVHHLVLFTFPPRSLPFHPSPHRTPPPCSSILPSHHPSSAPPPPPDSEPSLFLAHRPRLPPSSLPPPPLPLPPSHLSRHCRRAPGVPQTLFSTIKLLSLPLPGSCKNNLG